ncbi:Ribosome Assembly protein [Ceraceosorus bombacis]|uniref:Ribosome Assembly protein n=1 Tax=Ceraceosorus bombacis TaxID=401625 RepID=A0A0P1BH92_9BASI|nr:Ribosome Assembly protein [Ceraceosorus bombacis]
MSKRPSSPVQASTFTAGPSRHTDLSAKKRTAANGSAPHDEDDEGMGEFEDRFEDEFESEDDGEVVDAASDSDDDEEGEGMEIDGVKVSGRIQRPEGEDDEVSGGPETQAWLAGAQPLEEGQVLEPDQSAYEMLHRMGVNWPCLSFDVLLDNLGPAEDRVRYPHTAYFAAGTQADTAKNNELIVYKASSLHRTIKDGDESDDDEDDDDDEGLDDDAILESKSIPHLGGVNRVRAAPVAPPSAGSEPTLDPYPVAVWSELGSVGIWDVRPLYNALERPGPFDKARASKALHTVPHSTEGYAMDWAGSSSGAGRQSSLRLLSGDGHGLIKLTTSNNAGYTTHAAPFTSHTSSVEDLQWSPKEPTVFASCSADRSIRIWDVRVKSHKSVIALDEAHEQDVNVISWNKKTDYLLLSGGDEGGLNVWDLRNFKPSSSNAARPTSVANFRWHQAPVSSVEWHPSEDSVFAASGRDDQVTLWDLSVEMDDEEQPGNAQKGPNGEDVPSQLLFCHHGASEIKEVHWHPQIQSMLITTSADGFHLFKTISV